MKLTRKELADLLSRLQGDEISVNQVRKNEALWGLDGARLPDLNQRTIRYDKKKSVAAWNAFMSRPMPEAKKLPPRRSPLLDKSLRKRINQALRFGISFDELDKKFNDALACEICLREFKECFVKPCKAVVDHDHKTGKLRGILCSQCNTALGMVRDSPDVLRRAADYLERYSGATGSQSLL